jgi:type I restriction enzyme S subunit
LVEQRRIADILDKADSLRVQRRTTVRKLGGIANSLFLETFGDPAANPKNWPVEAVSSYVDAFQGGRSFESDSGGEHTARNRVLKISAVTGMTFLPHESKPVPDYYTPPQDHFVREGDLLISRAYTAALVGAVAYVAETPNNLILPDKLWRFVWGKPARADPLFVWSLFQTQAIRNSLSRLATGTGGSMKNISQAKLLRMPTIVPPMEAQRAFVKRLLAMNALAGTCERSAADLGGLFASLQHRAFRGEL